MQIYFHILHCDSSPFSKISNAFYSSQLYFTAPQSEWLSFKNILRIMPAVGEQTRPVVFNILVCMYVYEKEIFSTTHK